MRAKQVIIDHFGGPDVLKYHDVELGTPASDEITIQHEAIGLNYIDTYHRSGLYPIPLPSPLGLEAAGIVTAVGDVVKDFQIGDRVAYCWGPIGAYATHRNIKAEMVVPLDDDISFDAAAALFLKACTAEYLIRRTYKVQKGETVLFHAAAGGVGLIACRWLSHLGAKVIGTVGSDEKAKLAKDNGCDHVINYQSQNFENAVKGITQGEGVDVVFDGVGKATWEGSLNVLKPRGMMVTYGNASGPVTNVDLGILAQKGSLYVTRPTLFDYYTNRQERLKGSRLVMQMIRDGIIDPHIGQRFALKDIQDAHRAIESRQTIGSTILHP